MIYILLPAYNEAKNLIKIFKKITKLSKKNKNIKIKELIKSINRKSQKPLKVKFLGSNSIKPNKNFLKTLPNWKADITIQKKIEKYFYHETN